MLNDSYYLYVEVVAQRCSQLMRGAKPKIDLRAHKFTTVARQEVREELIPWQQATDKQLAAELAAGAGATQEEATATAVAQLGGVRRPQGGRRRIGA